MDLFSKPLESTPYGAPNTAGDPNRSHAEATAHRSPDGKLQGVSGGLGIWDGPLPGLGPDRSLQVADMRGDLGCFKDRDGNNACGVNLDAELFGYKGPNLDFGTASGRARMSMSSKTTEVGIGLGGPGAAWTTGKADKSSGKDDRLRAGFSTGPGASVRAHYGDEDGDEKPEYGVGADVGPLSFDAKSEDPKGALGRIKPMPERGILDAISNLFGYLTR
jgi:hypothetical protein